MDVLIEALQAEGCEVSTPRYPLLHQQPFFTEGFWQSVARLPADSAINFPIYKADALPQIERENGKLVKLPNFPSARKELLDQYALAFEKTIHNAAEIVASAKNKNEY